MKLPQTPEHHIQRQILERLQKAPIVRFADLKPSGMESNLFLYHLRKLIKTDLVVKQPEGYGLTVAGKAYVVRSNHQTLLPRLQPVVLSVLCINDPKTDNWLVLCRKLQPYLGTVGFPSGKIHEGENFEDAAKRELKEKTGREDITLVRRGVFEVRYFEADELARHVLCVVSAGEATSDDKRFGEGSFETYWAPRSELFGENTFPEHEQILKQLKDKTPFINSFDVHIGNTEANQVQ